jgi:glutathione synthase
MKPIKIAVLMDDISTIKPQKDSSLAMMLEAKKRHWEIYTFDANDMFFQQGQIMATCAKTQVFDNTTNWYKKEPKADLFLADFDVTKVTELSADDYAKVIRATKDVCND